MDDMKNEKNIIIDEEFRMKVVNFLNIYGDYKGVLSHKDILKKYVGGELRIVDIIQSKKDYKELRFSIKKVLNYCYSNGFDVIENIMNCFYDVECADIRKKYGGFFDRNFHDL